MATRISLDKTKVNRAGGGLAQSMQVIGPRYGEDVPLDAAAELEVGPGIRTPIDPR